MLHVPNTSLHATTLRYLRQLLYLKLSFVGVDVLWATLDPHGTNWETEIAKIPCIAVTDSKSLYDTITYKMCNTAAHIDDKRTAIDVTILKRDFKTTQGQIRWIEGTRMIADCLTKKMKGSDLRNVLIHGYWSLCEQGFKMPCASELQLLFGV